MARRKRRRDKVTGKKLKPKKKAPAQVEMPDEVTELFMRCKGYAVKAPSSSDPPSYQDLLAQSRKRDWAPRSKKSRLKERKRVKKEAKAAAIKAKQPPPQPKIVEPPSGLRPALSPVYGHRPAGAPMRVVPHYGDGTFVLRRVYSVNSRTRGEFVQFRNELASRGAPVGSRRLFHGTRMQSVPDICLESLKVPEPRWYSGMFGRGIYLAPKFVKAWGFAGVEDTRFVFVAKVLLGRVKIMEEGDNTLTRESLPAEYDSVHGKAGFTKTWTRPLNYDEYVVYDKRQVLITHLLEYTRGG